MPTNSLNKNLHKAINTKKDRFSFLFEKHYKRLLNYSLKTLGDKHSCEELVQETFIKLWQHIEKINPEDRSIESFLIVTLKNKIIDNHRKNQSREKHNKLYNLYSCIETEIDSEWELCQRIEAIYRTLNKKTLDIFQLSRDKGLTYKEIAIRKKISIKTVELHISKALNAFREGLKDYL